jgi:excisionase family DNA binding protein
MDASEAADWLRVDRTTLYAEARAGTIPSAKAGGRWRFSREQLLAFLAGEVSLEVET